MSSISKVLMQGQLDKATSENLNDKKKDHLSRQIKAIVSYPLLVSSKKKSIQTLLIGAIDGKGGPRDRSKAWIQ